MIVTSPFYLFVADGRLFGHCVRDLLPLLTPKRPRGVAPLPDAFLYPFQLRSDAQFFRIGEQSELDAKLEGCEQRAKFAEHHVDIGESHLLTFYCRREVAYQVVARSLHFYRRTLYALYLRHVLNGGMENV